MLVRFAVCVAVAVSASAVFGQPAEKPKALPELHAEQALRDARCSLHNEDTKFQLQRGVRVPISAGGFVDHVVFPSDTKDADLWKLLPHVAKLTRLTCVDLTGCKNVTAQGLKKLQTLPKVEVLVLDDTMVNAAGLKELAGVKGLRHLELSGTPLTDPDFKALAGLQQLQSLVIHGMPKMTAAGLRNILDVQQIQHLDVAWKNAVNADVTQTIGRAKFLLSLRIAPVTDDDLAEIGKIPVLINLDLGNDQQFGQDRKGRLSNRITTDGMNKLAGCKSLRSLDVSFNSATGEELQDFLKIDSLEEIYLRGSSWSDKGVAKLGTMPTLRVVDLRETKVRDKAMEDLADLPRLQRLYLAGTALTDSGLQKLTRLRTLQVLDLSSTNVSCARVPDMKNFTQLEHLHLAGTRVSIASFTELSSIKSLRFLNLLDNMPDITSDNAQPLNNDLPKCMIIASKESGEGYYSWPGSRYFTFYVPPVRSNQPPVISVPVVKVPVISVPVVNVPVIAVPNNNVVTRINPPAPPPIRVGPAVAVPAAR